MKAARVMKARRPGRCALCRQLVTIGQQIGRTPAGWAHTACIIERAQAMVRNLDGTTPATVTVRTRR